MVNAVKVFTLRLCISAYYIHFKRVKVKIFTAFTITKAYEQKNDSYAFEYNISNRFNNRYTNRITNLFISTFKWYIGNSEFFRKAH